MKNRIPAFFAILALSSSIALGQSTDQIASLLGVKEKKTAVLRNYYTDGKLTFDSNGKLTSPGTIGFGPTDGRLFIEQVKLEPDKLLLLGKRTVPFYDEGSGSFKQMITKQTVKLEISRATGQGSADALVPVLENIFMKQSELDDLKCSVEGAKVFHDYLSWVREPDIAATKLPEARDRPGPTRMCFPYGEWAFKPGQGVHAPKVISAPDPHYPENARKERLQGDVVLVLIIDKLGKPSTILAARPLGHGFDEKACEAVKTWSFEPATWEGQPIPVGINVVVRFRLY